MKIVESGDPGILELRTDVVGVVVLAGLLFIIGGGLAIAFTLGVLPVETSVVAELKNISLAAGAVSIMLGLLFAGGRSGKILDGRSRSLTSWSGLFVPLRRKHKSLDGYSWVVLVKEVSSSKNSSNIHYPVRLEGDTGKALKIGSCTDPLEARRTAEAVAKVMHLPLTDSTSGQAVIRDPDHLDESLRDRVRRLGEKVEMPPRPPIMRSQIVVTSSEVVAEIPGISTKTRLIMTCAVMVLVLGIGFVFFGPHFAIDPGSRSEADPPLFLITALLVGIPLLVILGKLGRFNQGSRITANRITLIVVQGNTTTEIPGDELEELSITGKDISHFFQTRPDGSMVVDSTHQDTPEGATYSSKHGQPPTIPPALAGIVKTLGRFSPERLSILACSDRASVKFGGGLDSEELSYLYSAIMKVMVD